MDYTLSHGVVLDFDSQRQLVGIDIDHASQIVDLTRLEAAALPLEKVSVQSGPGKGPTDPLTPDQ